MAPIAIRPARADEAPLVLEMLRATSVEQGNEHELCVDLNAVREDGFGAAPRFHFYKTVFAARRRITMIKAAATVIAAGISPRRP